MPTSDQVEIKSPLLSITQLDQLFCTEFRIEVAHLIPKDASQEFQDLFSSFPSDTLPLLDTVKTRFVVVEFDNTIGRVAAMVESAILGSHPDRTDKDLLVAHFQYDLSTSVPEIPDGVSTHAEFVGRFSDWFFERIDSPTWEMIRCSAVADFACPWERVDHDKSPVPVDPPSSISVETADLVTGFNLVKFHEGNPDIIDTLISLRSFPDPMYRINLTCPNTIFRGKPTFAAALTHMTTTTIALGIPSADPVEGQ